MKNSVDGVGMTSRRTRDRMIDRLRKEGIKNENVLAAMSQVPRHLFIDEAFATRAYDDVSLPIGFGQTISQPYMVARLCELVLAEDKIVSKILEIGTGCAYQAAVLSFLGHEVFSIERIRQLAEESKARLSKLKYRNIRVRLGDGYLGWPREAPFDAIVISAAAAEVPEGLKGQLALGGSLIVPTGTTRQKLTVIVRTNNGYEESSRDSVKFVPMLSGLSI